MQSRKWLLAGLIPLCLFVAGYCAVAGLASGGWHLDWVNGEPSYSAPGHYSSEFYKGAALVSDARRRNHDHHKLLLEAPKGQSGFRRRSRAIQPDHSHTPV